jgi:hypothetical protein
VQLLSLDASAVIMKANVIIVKEICGSTSKITDVLVAYNTTQNVPRVMTGAVTVVLMVIKK